MDKQINTQESSKKQYGCPVRDIDYLEYITNFH